MIYFLLYFRSVDSIELKKLNFKIFVSIFNSSTSLKALITETKTPEYQFLISNLIIIGDKLYNSKSMGWEWKNEKKIIVFDLVLKR